MAPKRQNIIFILTDQQRKDLLECYGSTMCKTPAINLLATEGIVFENAYAVAPLCTPARASIQTGVYPNRHGMQNNLFQPGCLLHELPDTPKLLSRQLERAGYARGYTGKWHLGYGKEAYENPHFTTYPVSGSVNKVVYPSFYRDGSSLPTDLGFEGDDFPGHGDGGHNYPQYQKYLKEKGLTHDVNIDQKTLVVRNRCGEITSSVESAIDYYLVERAISHIDCLSTRKDPFFFMLSFWGPHIPAFVPTEFYEAYRELSIPPWPTFNEDQKFKPSIHNTKRINVPWSYFETYTRYTLAYYEFIDNQVGRLLKYLKSRDLYNDSFIIYSSDHGDSLGIHGGLVDKGFHMYEETCSIPLIVKAPVSMEIRGREPRFVNTTDLYSTILDIAGIPKGNYECEGRSLLPLIVGKKIHDWPNVVVSEFSGLAYVTYSQRMIRKGKFKYIFNCGDLDELYDLQDDPYETRNLAVEKESAALLKEMRVALSNWMIEHNDNILKYYNYIVENTYAQNIHH